MKNIVIFLGQSNMVSSYPDAGDIVAPYDSLPRADIDYSHWAKSGATTRDGGEGTVGTLNTVSGWYACEISAMQRLADVYGWTDLAAIKVAEGSTDLATDWADGGTLMTRLRDYVREHVATYADEGWRIIAVVRMQGESDSNDATDAGNFQTNLANHYSALRADFFEGYASLPVIECRIKKSPNGFATTETIQQTQTGQANVTNADSKAILVDTSDLDQLPDNVHFTGSSVITMGERVADAINSLATK